MMKKKNTNKSKLLINDINILTKNLIKETNSDIKTITNDIHGGYLEKQTDAVWDKTKEGNKKVKEGIREGINAFTTKWQDSIKADGLMPFKFRHIMYMAMLLAICMYLTENIIILCFRSFFNIFLKYINQIFNKNYSIDINYWINFRWFWIFFIFYSFYWKFTQRYFNMKYLKIVLIVTLILAIIQIIIVQIIYRFTGLDFNLT